MSQRTSLRVSKNAVALLMARVTMLLLGLWLNGQLTRAVGIARFGRYLLALTVEGITLAVVNAGLNLYATREFARETYEDQAALLGSVLALKAFLALGAIVLLNGVIAPLFFAGTQQAVIAIASLGLLPQALNSGMEALFKGRQRMELSSLIEVLSRLAGVLAGLVFIVQGGDERHVLICGVVGYMLGTVAYGSVLHMWHIAPRWRGWHTRAVTLLREALPFAGADIVAMLYRRADLLLLSMWHGDVAVGIYGAAYRLWETLGLLPASFLDALFPELVRRASTTTGRLRLRQLTWRGGLGLTALVVLIGGPSFWLAPQAMTVLYGDIAGVETATNLLRLLILALPCTYLYLLNGHILYAAGEQSRVLKAMAAVTLGNVAVNALLIPRWSYWGAATTALLSEIGLLALLGSTAWRRVLRLLPGGGGQ
ncbi:MAG: flippase [Anaerolineae bacterium]|nr:flippase [Anaerolineae bacterium]